MTSPAPPIASHEPTDPVSVARWWLEDFARGPQHMGYIQGIRDRDWAEWARGLQSEVLAFLAGKHSALAAPVVAPAEPMSEQPNSFHLGSPVPSEDLQAALHEETPAEDALRSLACWLGVGGYNAPTVDATLFETKIREGVTVYSQLHGFAARDLAEQVLHMDLVTQKGQHARELARRVLGLTPMTEPIREADNVSPRSDKKEVPASPVSQGIEQPALAQLAPISDDWRDQLETLLDIWDDAKSSPPGEGTYVPGALGMQFEEARALLEAVQPSPAPQAAMSDEDKAWSFVSAPQEQPATHIGMALPSATDCMTYCACENQYKCARRAAGLTAPAAGVALGVQHDPRMAFCPACFVGVTPEQADQQTLAARTLAEFAKTAPGRLPQRVQDAIAFVAAGVNASDTYQLSVEMDEAIRRGARGVPGTYNDVTEGGEK